MTNLQEIIQNDAFVIGAGLLISSIFLAKLKYEGNKELRKVLEEDATFLDTETYVFATEELPPSRVREYYMRAKRAYCLRDLATPIQKEIITQALKLYTAKCAE